jgi:pentatricopeptide repeat protein
MCLICNDKKATTVESLKNLFEMGKTIDDTHFAEVYCALLEKLAEEGNVETGLDMLEKLLDLEMKNLGIETGLK